MARALFYFGREGRERTHRSVRLSFDQCAGILISMFGVIASLLTVAPLGVPQNHPYEKLSYNLWNSTSWSDGFLSSMSTNIHSAAVGGEKNFCVSLFTEFERKGDQYLYNVVMEVWELSASKKVAGGTIPDNRATDLAASSDGKHIVVGGADTRYYKGTNGKIQPVMTWSPAVDPATGEVGNLGTPAAITDDGTYLAAIAKAGSGQYVLRLLKLPNFTQVGSAVFGLGQTTAEPQATFMEGGKKLVVHAAGLPNFDYQRQDMVSDRFIFDVSKDGLKLASSEVRKTRPGTKDESFVSAFLDHQGAFYAIRRRDGKDFLERDGMELFSFGPAVWGRSLHDVNAGRYVFATTNRYSPIQGSIYRIP